MSRKNGRSVVVEEIEAAEAESASKSTPTTDSDPADPDPADEGFRACEEGESLSDNPYPKGSISWGKWKEGWQNAASTASP